VHNDTGTATTTTAADADHAATGSDFKRGRLLVRALSLATALLVVCSVAWYMWHERAQALASAAALSKHRVSGLAEDLSQTLQLAQLAVAQAEAHLQALPPGAALHGALGEAPAERAQVLARLPLPFELHALDDHGHVLELAPRDTLAPGAAHDPHQHPVPLPGRGGWQPGLTQGAPGRMVVPLLRRAAPSGRGVAAYVVDLDHAALLRRLEAQRVANGGGITLFRVEPDGSTTVLARVPFVAAELGMRVRGPVALALPQAPSGSFDALTLIDKVWRHVAYQRLDGDAASLVLAYGMAHDATLADWRATVPWAAGLALLVATGVLAIGWRLEQSLAALQRHQQALARSEGHFRALADNLPDVVVRLDREGRHRYANGAVQQATGLPPQAFIGKSNAELGMPAENVAVWMATLDRVFAQGGAERLEFAFPGPNGLRQWESLVALEPDIPGEPPTALVISRDITARRQAEAARARLDRQLADVLETMSDGFVSLDRRWCYLYVNQRAGQLFGREPASLVGRHIWTEFPEGVGQPFQLAYEAAMQSGEMRRLEAYYPPWDRWFENRIHPTADGISIFFTDITENRRALAALRDSEERLRLALQATHQGLYDLDLRTGQSLVSPEYARLHGQGSDWQVDSNAAALRRMHPDDRGRVAQAFDDYVSGRSDHYRVEFRQSSADGGWKWILSLGQIQARDAEGRPSRMLGTHTDITPLKQAQAAQAATEARLTYLLTQAPAVIYTAQASGDFAATYYSPNLPDLLGWAGEQFLGDPGFWLDHVHPDDRDAVLAQLDALHRQDDLVLEYRFQHARGHWLWMRDQVSVQRDAAGQAIELVGSWIDITSRREAEDRVRQLAADLERKVHERTVQLAQSEARYRNIFDTVPVAISEEDWSGVQRLLREVRDGGVTDGPAFLASRPDVVAQCLAAVQVQRLNRKALALHDLSDGRTEVRSLNTFYPQADDLAQFVGELEALWTGQRLHSAKRSLPSVTGRPLSLMLTMSLPTLDDADALALVCLVDITEIDRLNAELDRSVARLRQANKELETFTYSVSHDLKAPLRGIDGYSRLLMSEYHERLDGEGRSFLANIRQATQHMGVLIDDLLAYSRLERRDLNLGRLPLAPLVDGVLLPFRADLASAGAALEVDVPVDLHVLADAQGLSMALRNLVDNALKFSRDRQPRRLVLRATRVGDGVQLAVTDNGVGFDMKFHDRIFSIFQRLHRVEDYPGTGVGLAIVRKAMERMGGRVWAASQPGQGATFTLELPWAA
jgi:PAS domain S-box-containing protein